MLDRLERKIGWVAFPSIIRYLAFFQLGVLALSFVNPGASELLSFNWSSILEGQVWRLISFIFIPVGTLSGTPGAFTVIFSIFAALILMRFSDGIESRWGHFRTTLFFLGCWLSCMIASIVFSTILAPVQAISGKLMIVPIPLIIQPSMLFDYAIFFTFATLHPKFELRLFFILPVQIWIIAIVAGITVLLSISMGWQFLAYSLLCLAPYLMFAIPMVKQRGKVKAHKIKYQARQKKPSVFHTCSVCGITDVDDPNLEFRVRTDGTEICENCRKK